MAARSAPEQPLRIALRRCPSVRGLLQVGARLRSHRCGESEDSLSLGESVTDVIHRLKSTYALILLEREWLSLAMELLIYDFRRCQYR